jgi:hypothetical protein
MPEKADSVHLSGRLRDGNEGGRQEMEGKGQRPDANAQPHRPDPDKSGPDLNSERANSRADGGRATDGPRGAIEREPVAGGVNLPSP